MNCCLSSRRIYNISFYYKVCPLYRGVLYEKVILYSKECNWYTRYCLLNGGVCSIKKDASVYIIIILLTDNLMILSSDISLSLILSTIILKGP